MRKLLYILWFISLPLFADDYYVSSAGNDGTGDGSVGNPWKTLSTAAGYAVSEDIIYIVNDITDNYRVVLRVGVSIIGLGTPTITTSYVAASTGDGYLYLYSAPGNAVDGNQSISYISINGNNLTATRVGYVAFRKNVKIHHCTFTNFRYCGIRFNGTTGGWSTTPTNTLPTGNEVYNCTFTNLSTRVGNGTGGHVRIEGQNGMKVYNNTFDQRQRATGYNGNIMAGYQSEAVEITGNIFYKNNSEYTAGLPAGETWNFFCEFHYTRGGWIVADNEFNGAACWDQSGVVKGIYSFGVKIYGNVFQTTSAPVYNPHNEPYLDLETFSYANDIYVYQNYFKYSRIGILLDNVYTSSDNVWIYSNVFEKTGNSTNGYSNAITIGSRWDDGAWGIPISNLYIYNNTIDAGKACQAGINVTVVGNISNFNIRNNIINGPFSRPIIFATSVSPTIAVLNIQNNDYYGNGTNSVSYSSGITYVNRVESDNLTVNPGFVGTSDFRLDTLSNVIGEGMALGLGVTYVDYLGIAWNDPPSIGAYEFGTPIEPPIIIDYPSGILKGNNRFIILNNKLLKLE